MSDRATGPGAGASSQKQVRKLERALARSEERLADFESRLDRTQHMLNTRIDEVEQAREALRAHSAELAESETRFRQLAEAAFEAILMHEGARIVDCNDAATQLYGVPREALLGTSVIDLIDPEYRPTARVRLADPPDAPFESLHLGADGRRIQVEVRVRAISQHGHPARVTAVRDITERKALEEQLRHLACTDPLTGVNNRRHYIELSRGELALARRNGYPFAVLMLDVDHFKRINDTHGHEIGDQALHRLCEVAGHAMRLSDIFGRLGGEEFAMTLPSTALDGAVVLADRLRETLSRADVAAPGGALNFTVSIGVTDLQPGDSDVEGLLNRADKALYAAKSGGRNRVVAG